MPEINLGNSNNDDNQSTGSSTPSSVEEMLDELESLEERLRNNPGLRKMFGIELDDMTDDTQTQTTDATPPAQDSLDASFLEDVLGEMCAAGYDGFTLKQLHKFVENNPDEVNQMIATHTNQE